MNQETRKKEEKLIISRNLAVTSIAAAVILGVISVSFIRKSPDFFSPVKKQEFTVKDVFKWHQAVKEGREKKAIMYAKKIVPYDTPSIPNPDYIHLLVNNRLGTLILTSPFNHFDYLRWKDAFEIKKIAHFYAETEKEPIEKVFKAVISKQQPDATKASMSLVEMFHVKLNQYKDKPYVSIIDIWNKGYASLDELFRLFAAISYQSGYAVQIIALYDEEWKTQHVVCELRKNGTSYLADPVNGKIWKDMTIYKIASNPERVKGIWSDKTIQCLKRCVYRLPAEPMDYKLNNRKLYSELNSSEEVNIPLFGIDPQKRIDRFIQMYINKVKKRHFSYWNFPFHSLMSSPNFPQDWRLPGRAGGEIGPSNQVSTGKTK